MSDIRVTPSALCGAATELSGLAERLAACAAASGLLLIGEALPGSASADTTGRLVTPVRASVSSAVRSAAALSEALRAAGRAYQHLDETLAGTLLARRGGRVTADAS